MKSIFLAAAFLLSFQATASARAWTSCFCKIERSDQGFGWYLYGSDDMGRQVLVEESEYWEDKGSSLSGCNSRLRYLQHRRICT